MKKIIKLSLIIALAVLGTVSCDLNKYPYDQIEQSQALKTVDDANALRNGLYANLRGRLYGIYTFPMDIQADLLNATLDYGNRNGSLYRWDDFLADNYTLRDYWSGIYSALVNVNNVINNIDKIEVSNADDQALIDQYKGEAYFLRAYYYHQLVLRYAKDYEPSSASTDLGVPLVLTFDVTLLPERATIQAVYDQINNDLSEAKTLLSSVAGEADANRITIDCVTALDARVKLCMHDYSGAMTAANSLISSGTYPLITNEADLKKMWVNDISSEVIFQFPLSAPNELGNTNAIYLGYKPDIDKYSPDFVPEQWVVDLYADNDIRKNVYLETKPLNIQGFDYEGIYCINKYSGNPELWTGANTNYQQKPKVFRVAEMYLISAEASAQGGGDGGLDRLNELRAARGLSALQDLSGTELMNAVKEERLREMLAEGTRLDDLKRWHDGFTRTSPQNMDIILTGNNTYQKSVDANADKFVWGIPTNDITTNPNIANQQNPGW